MYLLVRVGLDRGLLYNVIGGDDWEALCEVAVGLGVRGWTVPRDDKLRAIRISDCKKVEVRKVITIDGNIK